MKCHLWLNMLNGSCNDRSMAVLDRRPVLVDLWTPVPSYELVINGVPRTVIATNETEDLKVFLDFSIPIVNVTEQILNVLRVNAGNFIPSHGSNHGNRSFAFEVSLEASTLLLISLCI